MSRLPLPAPGSFLLTAGAYGTELQKRGLPVGSPSDLWNLTRPDEVVMVARAFVEAGSQVILTNTFQANAVALGALGAAGQMVAINRRGAELARLAAGGAWVFGSMGPIGAVGPGVPLSTTKRGEVFLAQAEALAEGGVDALILETCGDLEEACVAVRAARRVGLPIVASFFLDPRDVGDSGPGKDKRLAPEEAGRVMAQEGAEAVGANCGAGPAGFAGLCRRLKRSSGLPVWIKPAVGLPTIVDGRAVYATTPDAFATFLPDVLEAGASFVGGCCGAGPEFIRALARRRAAGPGVDRGESTARTDSGD
jgi:5-methyltetrahydrofolate--homocysteine methyltransferase